MKLKTTIILFAAATLFASCNLDRQPLNGPSSGTFPASEGEAYAGTLAAYKGISLMNAQSNYFPYIIEDCASDNFSYRTGAGNFQKQLNSTLTADNALVEKEYKYVYKVVGRVHQVLDNIDNLLLTSGEDVVNRYTAELLCIRAHQYDQAMQFYGGIPFITHCLTLSDNAYPRNTLKECADSILFTDLTDEHLNALPLQWDQSFGTTRIGRIAAYMLKARIALNWGYAELAVEAAEKALALNSIADNPYALEELDTRGYVPHADGELDNTALFGFAGEKSKEWLWAIQRSKLVGELQQDIVYAAPRTVAGVGWLGPKPTLIDCYQCLDGKSILESPLYDYKNPYLNRDPRMAITTCLPGTRAMGVQYEMDCTVEKVMNYNSGQLILNSDSSKKANKYEYGANGTKGPGGFYFRKHYDVTYYNDGSIKDKEDELNTGVLRYAELLLIAAEAHIESASGNLSKARDYINQVRTRVNMPTIAATSREDLRSALRYERRVELAGEGARWFDIRRWSDNGLCYKDGEPVEGAVAIAQTAVNGVQYAPAYSTDKAPKAYIWKAKPTIDKNWIVTYDGATTWDNSIFDLRNFDVEMVYNDYKDRRWPFPYTEITTNPAMDPVMDQNPGYVTGN